MKEIKKDIVAPIGGISLDTSELKQPKDKYRAAVNVVLQSKEGNMIFYQN